MTSRIKTIIGALVLAASGAAPASACGATQAAGSQSYLRVLHDGDMVEQDLDCIHQLFRIRVLRRKHSRRGCFHFRLWCGCGSLGRIFTPWSASLTHGTTAERQTHRDCNYQAARKSAPGRHEVSSKR